MPVAARGAQRACQRPRQSQGRRGWRGRGPDPTQGLPGLCKGAQLEEESRHPSSTRVESHLTFSMIMHRQLFAFLFLMSLGLAGQLCRRSPGPHCYQGHRRWWWRWWCNDAGAGRGLAAAQRGLCSIPGSRRSRARARRGVPNGYAEADTVIYAAVHPLSAAEWLWPGWELPRAGEGCENGLVDCCDAE